MPQKILHQVKYLCSQIKKVEWSGVLFYSVEGSIKDPQNMVITLQEVFPMQKGTATFTEYDFGDPKLIEFMMANQELCSYRMAHIHSHNVMNVFFSGTDMDELHENSEFHNYYLSLIVNNFMEMTAKIAFRGSVNTSSAKDENGEEYALPNCSFHKDVLFIMNCEIQLPEETLVVSGSFEERTAEIIEVAALKEIEAEKIRAAKAKAEQQSKEIQKYQPSHSQQKYQNQPRKFLDDWDDAPVWSGGWPQLNPEEIEVEEDVEEEEELDLTGLFVAFCLRLGNPIPDDAIGDPIEDAVEELELSKITPEYLATTVVENYMNYYETFFQPAGDYSNFHEVLVEFIQTLEEGVETGVTLIEPLLQAMVDFANELNKNPVQTETL